MVREHAEGAAARLRFSDAHSSAEAACFFDRNQ
jgi:hypothetical protein